LAEAFPIALILRLVELLGSSPLDALAHGDRNGTAALSWHVWLWRRCPEESEVPQG